MIDPVGIDDLGDARARNHAIPPLREGQVGAVKAMFADQSYRPSYVFKGVKPLIDAESARAAYPDHSLRSRMHNDWFIAQASNSLGNACRQRDPKHAQAAIDRAVAIRDIMAIALRATEAAIAETARQLDLPEPHFARKPEVKPHGPRRIRGTVDPGE